ncbi:MAG: nucleoside hydrolase [Bacteroidota bacterium]|nr:nucleoside hydrolase [Bacteroidota bacterium]
MTNLLILFTLIFIISSCTTISQKEGRNAENKIPVIFDTDANNELDDQHAIAYLLFNGNTFDVKAITVNTTYNGGNIDEQYKEAERIIQLSGLDGKIPLYKGADGNFEQIKNQTNSSSFDGAEAVNVIIDETKKSDREKFVVIAVGKLTNVALALKKDPSITDKMKVVWLGSNYPEPGEYNQDNDTSSMNYVLNTNVEFEMVTVRYGKPSGTSAVTATKEEINQKMPGKGPKVENPITGRHGEAFTTFGDYSVNLFEHIEYEGDPPSRALYDMAAVAIIKDPSWAEKKEITAPVLINNQWVERPGNQRKIIVWENFNKDKIMADFYDTMENYVLID